MKEMCAECGADLRTDEVTNRDVAVVPMVHSVPELKVGENQLKNHVEYKYLKISNLPS